MYDRIKNTDIFVFPSLRTSQSGGLPAAITRGKLVVIRSEDELPEMIENNKDRMIANWPP